MNTSAASPSGDWAGRKLVALFGVLLALKFAAAFIQPFDTDEPQHMHVVWGWLSGQVQYRDFFDNHMPLFHLLMRPIMRLMDEGMGTLYALRLTMLIFYLGSLGALYALARHLYPPALARPVLLAAAAIPLFFLTSTEFRADDLWMLAWFACLAVLLAPGASHRKSLLAGICLGAAFATSLKSVLMLEAMALATAMMAWLTAPADGWRSWSRSLAFLAGCLLIPAAVVLHVWMLGVFDDFLYCVMHANLAVSPSPQRLRRHLLFLLMALAALSWLARRLPRTSPGEQTWLFLFLITACYWLLLYYTWPLITRQDFLPGLPLILLLLPAGQRWLARQGRWPRRLDAVWGWLFGLEAGVILVLLMLARQDPTNAVQAHGLHDALDLTTPAQYVMDLKGETVFRRRPYYYVLESVTRARLRRHELADTIADDLIRTRTLVVVGDLAFYTGPSRRFIAAHYLDVGHLRVAGQWLPAAGGQPHDFEIVIPAIYALSSPQGAVQGLLDGQPYSGARLLTAGPHRFIAPADAAPVAVIWAPALAKGYLPAPPAAAAEASAQ